jgi:two-component system, OmpR family, phosphate regulon sensor histidine kinase PhoR
MLMAMLGLIGFQWYWIRNAYLVKKEQFDRKVTDALIETVHKIEKQEVLFWTKQKLKAEEKNRNDSLLHLKTYRKLKKSKPVLVANPVDETEALTNTVLPKSFEIYNEFPSDIVVDKRFKFPQNKILFLREMLAQENLIWEELNLDMQEMILQQQNLDDIFEILNDQNFAVKQNQENIDKPKAANVQKPKQNLKDEYDKTKNKIDLVKDVIQDIVRGDKKIYERLNQQMIDTLLTKELKLRGIDIPFEYGIKNEEKIMFASFGINNNPVLLSKSYNVALFPNDEVSHNQTLNVYFPKKENYLLENMWSVFGSSFFLIIMIGGLFYSSIQTIIKQKKLSDTKNDFINNMTHELKTPIATISLAVEVMNDVTIQKNETKAIRYLNMIRDENKRLADHVERVLQMALLDKGDIKFNFIEINAHEIIEQVCQNLSLQVEQLNGSIKQSLEAKNFEIYADEVHLVNVFYNLLDNALKYSENAPKVEISSFNENKELVIIVKDEGLGMSKDQINKVFDKFYRIPTGNLHNVKGFGLGLSYVKKIMDTHKGSITVQSKIGLGSSFELRFPLN